MNALRKKTNANAKASGFTIIEVVLVLAIAGLIFLMVFIALPALQSSQRDTARKNDVSAVASAITSYTSNNRGSFPTTVALTGSATGDPDASGKFAGYITSVSNNTTNVKVVAAQTSQSVTQGQMIVVQSSKCGTTGAASNGSATETLTAGTSRQFAVVTFLEAGGGTSYCQDS
ncbi:MAG: type II secretion system protein [Candidatus Microsaccharimonas sossegonensis]|uniref:Type II secretion system protein n=1 Tax=Candidatus Microsaccharimonas sossegonensis TaxID=2506948 RepID=A0A4Q0AII3_9BACT|nr:MAG: type II secretion system protein [Candidatus Microsaccharimonas sossegonensis]